MNPTGLALASAASWGTSDFLGGIAARRITPYQTVALAHGISLAAILALLFLFHIPAASHSTVFLGLCAGLFGGSGLVLFYEALATGAMGLTAAIAGVLSAAVPVVYSLLTEGLPKPHQMIGVAIAIAAIWMIAAAPAGSEKTSKRNLWLGAIAGSCFGVYFVVLKLASTGSATSGAVGAALWAVAFSRLTSASLASVLCLWVLRKRTRSTAALGIWGWRTVALAAVVGILDASANLLYALAARLGRMDIAAVLSSLYPAVTILLAAWILRERTSRQQTLGMALALGAVGLISS